MEPRMYDTMKTPKNYQELTDGTGTIEADETQQERLDEATERVSSGEFHIATPEAAFCKCIDGRPCEHALEGLNSSGGSLSYVVADDLTTKRFNGATFSETIDTTFSVLKEKGVKLGVHTDTHADDEKSGCGANDRLAEIYTAITSSAEALRAMTENILGNKIDDTTHQMIVENAAARSDFGSGAGNLSRATKDGAAVEKLEGGHREVAAIINLRDGTTFDRAAMRREFGDNYQVFNVDAHGFKTAAETISETDEEVNQKVVALAYYNIATALVLCGPKMRVCILR